MTSRSELIRGALGLGLMTAVSAGAALGQSLECTGPAPVGCFEATVTGDGGDSAQLSGFASSFGNSADGAWYAQLISPGGASGMMLMHNGGDLPTTGEYAIGDFVANEGAPPSGGFLATGNADPAAGLPGFQSVSGTLVITASSSTWVEGTFNYEGIDPQSGATVTVEGRFKAKHQAM